MSLSRELAVTAVLVLVLLFGLEAVVEPRHDVRNYEIFTEMVYSKAQESFRVSSILPGGMTQQALVEGVITRGELPFAYGEGPEEAQRAGRELVNPFEESSPDTLQRGRRVFGIFCANCHDSQGEGRGSVVMRGMLPPPSLLADRALAMADGEMFHVVTRGQGNMKSHAAQILAEDRWKAIRWIRVLQEGAQ